MKKEKKEKKKAGKLHSEKVPLGFLTENDGKEKPDKTIPPEVSNEVESFTKKADKESHK
ncbi:hypothetical protein [Lacticigenium naphthae]|uniref:hypothetical protein n=1 Tax=Lacticigenium naphthae TaxID=515351 RepID=UPI0004094BBC|nr:hypothetical protein [Lacticigenium naphthae]